MASMLEHAAPAVPSLASPVPRLRPPEPACADAPVARRTSPEVPPGTTRNRRRALAGAAAEGAAAVAGGLAALVVLVQEGVDDDHIIGGLRL